MRGCETPGGRPAFPGVRAPAVPPRAAGRPGISEGRRVSSGRSGESAGPRAPRESRKTRRRRAAVPPGWRPRPPPAAPLSPCPPAARSVPSPRCPRCPRRAPTGGPGLRDEEPHHRLRKGAGRRLPRGVRSAGLCSGSTGRPGASRPARHTVSHTREPRRGRPPHRPLCAVHFISYTYFMFN